MKKINPSILAGNIPKMEIVGYRECDNGCRDLNGDPLKVAIVKTVIFGKEQTVSECLMCLKRQDEIDAVEFKKQMEKAKLVGLFEKFSTVPFDLEDKTFDDYIPDHVSQGVAKDKCLYYANQFELFHAGQKPFTSLLIQGSYGLGKSALAESIRKVVLAKGFSTIFVDVPKLMDILRDTYSKNSEYSLNELMDALENVDLLIMDDLGAEYVKDEKNGAESWVVDKLFRIYGARVGKMTITTTNYGQKELTAKYGAHGGRIVSRMKQGTVFVRLLGDDYREKGF